MDAGQRALVAEVVEVFPDGLRRHLETAREVLHHHPAGGAGEVEDFGLAMRQSGHGDVSGKERSWCGRSSAGSTRPFESDRGRGRNIDFRLTQPLRAIFEK